MRKKKLGVIIQYYDFRNDMRELISLISDYYNLTLIVSRQNELIGEFPKSHKKLYVQSYKFSLRNKIWNTLYYLLGNRPKSRQNSLNWARRRFGSSNKEWKNYKELLLVYLSSYLPNWISFDTYLDYLQYNETDIKGIDTFLSFTDVTDLYFLAQLKKEQKKLITYVYSWDHAAKYFKFSKNWIQYLTWNEHIKEDLVYQHTIEPKNIQQIGSTQLSLLHSFLSENKNYHHPYNSEQYIYFGASMGYRIVAKQEIKYVAYLAKIMQEVIPDVKLVFRPYPLLKDWSLYEELFSFTNLEFDNFRWEGKEVVFTRDDVQSKFQKMQDALAVVHCGSTFGMEACYFDTPTFYLKFENFPFIEKYSENNSIKNTADQYHLKKYLELEAFENVITDYEHLPTILKRLSAHPEQYVAYNEMVASYTPLVDLQTIVERLQVHLGKSILLREEV